MDRVHCSLKKLHPQKNLFFFHILIIVYYYYTVRSVLIMLQLYYIIILINVIIHRNVYSCHTDQRFLSFTARMAMCA